LTVLLLLAAAVAVPGTGAYEQSQACYQQCAAAQSACESAAGGRPWTMGGWCQYNYDAGWCMTEYCIITGWPDPLPGTPIVIG
jgi:hypothetical protein